MDVLGTVLAFIGVLVVLVLVHEIGHFIVAKRAGITVQEFGVGFPPRIASVVWHGTRYSMNWIPLGGFVKMLGEDGDAEAEKMRSRGLSEAAIDKAMQGAFNRKPIWLRMLVLVAGVAMNFLLAALLFAVALSMPVQEGRGPLTVTEVQADSPAVAAGLRVGELLDGGIEIGLAEVRPQGRREDELRVGALPQQEVAGALLTAGADDQVGIALAGGVEVLGEAILVDLRDRHAGSQQHSGGVDDLRPPRVVEGDVERHPLAVPGPLLGLPDGAHDVGGGFVQAPDDAHPDALCDQLVGVLSHGAVDQAEQAGHLVVGAPPVLPAEDVEREHLDPLVGRDAHHRPDRLDPLDVASDGRQPPGGSPAAVAVHDDRDMSRMATARQRLRPP